MANSFDLLFQTLYKDILLYKGLDLLGLSFMLAGVYLLPTNKVVGSLCMMVASCVWFEFNLNINSYISMFGNSIMLLINFRTFVIGISKQKIPVTTKILKKENICQY